jgi:putative transposase
MPWKETSAVDERLDFVRRCLEKKHSRTALCRAFGISRETGHKWLRRFEEEGRAGLVDQSRRPLTNARATPSEIVELLLECRRRWGWGAKKLGPYLREKHPLLAIPNTSTISGILKRHGLTKPQKRRVGGVPPRSKPFSECKAPNDVWCADFKGDFKVGDGKRCYPLTVTDAFSRYVICCQGYDRIEWRWVQKAYERAFREHGLPKAMRTDNGAPFASHGAGGLTRLSVWLLKLGIELERIDPGRPQQNGRHERMHKTLKAETARPPRRSLRAQQAAFDRFRRVFNHERPHEALGQIPPTRIFESSPRAFPKRVEEPRYPGHFEIRKVYPVGQILWKGKKLVFVSGALAGEHVGLEEYDDGLWEVSFGTLKLGTIDDHDTKPKLIRPRRRPRQSRRANLKN